MHHQKLKVVKVIKAIRWDIHSYYLVPAHMYEDFRQLADATDKARIFKDQAQAKGEAEAAEKEYQTLCAAIDRIYGEYLLDDERDAPPMYVKKEDFERFKQLSKPKPPTSWNIFFSSTADPAA